MYKFRLKLEQFRKLKCMSQKTLALRANLSQSHISELERNKESPSLVTVENLADALKTYPCNLLEIYKNKK